MDLLKMKKAVTDLRSAGGTMFVTPISKVAELIELAERQEKELAGARFAADQHLNTVNVQAAVISGAPGCAGLAIKDSVLPVRDSVDLPPLPHCKLISGPSLASLYVLYSAEQMTAYARAALAQAKDAPSEPVSAPEAFASYVRANYNGVVDIHRPEWHAARLWRAAMHALAQAAPASPNNDDAYRAQYAMLGRIAEKDRALVIAEAALSDIGDADREPGDDLKWCEDRAARALPAVRSAMSVPSAPASPASAPVGDDRYQHWAQELVAALKRLSFAAQTSGGVAGPDAELKNAIKQAEKAMSYAAASRAIDKADATLAAPLPPVVARKVLTDTDIDAIYREEAGFQACSDDRSFAYAIERHLMGGGVIMVRTSMPILSSAKSGIRSIPWTVIAGHEAQAQRNHYQSLNRLAERGGLGVCEAVAIIEDRPWHRMDKAAAEARLLELCAIDAARLPGTNGSGVE